MVYDCAIIGGGPAGLSAALVLGRARRNVVVFDNNEARNAVTQESHGFITRDGTKPAALRKLAHEDIRKYASVRFVADKVVAAERQAGVFTVSTEPGIAFQARTLLLASGVKEGLPNVEGIRDYYGKSIFNCPYCDGWELRDRPLIVISENDHAFHMAKTIHHWSKDVFLCTNGALALKEEEKTALSNKGIPFSERKIRTLIGTNGMLERVVLEDGVEWARSGGFVTPNYYQASRIGELLGCALNPMGGVTVDGFGRTNVPGVYAAGDITITPPSQVVISAGDGSRAAIGINSDLIQAEF